MPGGRTTMRTMPGMVCAATVALLLLGGTPFAQDTQVTPPSPPVVEAPPSATPGDATSASEPPAAGTPAVETVAPTPPVPATPADAVGGWIAAVDASPDWKASGFVTTEVSGNVVIAGLSIAAERGDIGIAFDKTTLGGLAVDPNGGFSATSVKLDSGTVQYGFATFGLTRAEIAGVKVPALEAVAFDPAKPFTSLLKAYAALTRISVSGGSVATLTVIEKMQGITSRVAYENLRIGALAAGRLASLDAGPLTMISPAPEALAEITIARAEMRDIDLNALLHVYDPGAYAGGRGDMIWRNAFGQAAYRGLVMNLPGARLTIAEVGIQKFSVRQPPQSFASWLDAAGGEASAGVPPSDAELAALIATFGVGRLSVNDLKVEATGIDALSLKSFSLAGLSSDALAEFSIEGFRGGVEGALSVDLGRFALGGMKLPGADAIVAAVRTAGRGGNVDFSGLAPTFAFAEIAGVKVEMPELPRIAVDSFRADLGAYVGAIPTTVAIRFAGLDLPTRLLPIRVLAGMLASFGNDRVLADGGAKVAWNEATRDVVLDDLSLDMENIGTVAGSARLTGLTRDALVESGSLLAALPGIVFTGGTFTFTDKSLIERGLASRAAAMKVDPAKLRTQLATAVPFMLGFLGNADFQKQVGPVLKAFMLSPGTITATLAPPSPVPVPKIAETLRTEPQTLPAVLGVSVKGDRPANDKPVPPSLDPAPAAKEPTPAD
jgi:hypothetical protein